MNSETKNCQNCKKDFIIEPEDFNFYEKIKVPPPTFCPECRLQRKLTWRNERTLYKRKCDAPGHDEMLISTYPADAPLVVYDQKYWHGNEWDASSYARDYDFSQPFFKQWHELFLVVPNSNLININNTNSDYCNFVYDSKNCYLNFASDMNEDTSYLYHSIENRKCVDMLGSRKNENSYELTDCDRCYSSEHSTLCEDCIDVKYCYDCRNCQNCLGCTGLRSSKFCIFNKQYSPEDYKKELEKLSSRAEREKFEEQFKSLLLSYPRKFLNSRQAVNSTGDYLNHVKNCKDCFDVEGPAEDSRFVTYGVTGIRNVYDAFACGVSFENCCDVINTGLHASDILCSGSVWESYDISYSYFLKNCKNCFGCVGLRNKQYCILNKQYTQEEYEELVGKIKKHMDEMPYVDRKGKIYKEGEFFPAELSPFAYNESTAHQYFPLTKEETQSQGYRWRDTESKDYVVEIKHQDIPDTTDSVPDSIVGKAIECLHGEKCNEQCTKAYRIIPAEMQFYKTMNLPIPELCPNCRHYQRMKKRNPMKLWHRSCMCKKEDHSHGAGKCETTFETSYAPDRPEIVYCEKCYQAEVY